MHGFGHLPARAERARLRRGASQAAHTSGGEYSRRCASKAVRVSGCARLRRSARLRKGARPSRHKSRAPPAASGIGCTGNHTRGADSSAATRVAVLAYVPETYVANNAAVVTCAPALIHVFRIFSERASPRLTHVSASACRLRHSIRLRTVSARASCQLVRVASPCASRPCVTSVATPRLHVARSVHLANITHVAQLCNRMY